VVLWVAAERPDLVEGVVAVATSSVVGSAAAKAMTERIRLFENGDPDQLRSAILEDTRSQLARTDYDPEPLAAARLAAIGTGGGYINGARAVCAMRSDPIHQRLAEIVAPVLVVSGERDMWCPRRAAEIMLEQLGRARFVELPDVGHLLTDDALHRLAQIVRGWREEEVGGG
jgi:pimeloyl-ACP methyl ester carboxylesterase